MDRLLDRLISEDEFRSQFTDEVIMLGKIKAVNSAQPKFTFLQELLNSHPAAKEEVKYQDQVVASLKKQQKNKRIIRFSMGFAALLALAFVLPQLSENLKVDTVEVDVPEENQRVAFAYISSQQDAVWKDSKRNFQKQLFTEKIHLLSGNARIDFDYGASLIVSGETIIDVR